MGIFKSLFGAPKPPARPYVDEGVALTKKLIGLLNLLDWASGTPEYTQDESKAIDRELIRFGPMAEVLGTTIQRTLGAEALRGLAGAGWTMGSGWNLDGDCPDDWKDRISTYLKAWAMNLDPDALIEMGQLLALAGYKSEGRESARVVADRFSSYAPRFFVGALNPELVGRIAARARDTMNDISNMRPHKIAEPQSELPASLADIQSAQPAHDISKREVTHEEVMKLVKESSTRQLTDEEMEILTSRLRWRDEAAREQAHREFGAGSEETTAN